MEKVLSNKEIIKICERIGNDLTEKFKDEEVIVACVLKGAAPFHADLCRFIKLPIILDYLQLSSYNGGKKSSGVVTFKKDFSFNIEGKNVVIVEDIIDTGLSMFTLKGILEKRKPKSLTFVTLLDKPSKRKVDFVADYVGKTIDDLFVLGYGLDFDEKYRNLSEVYVFNEKEDYFN